MCDDIKTVIEKISDIKICPKCNGTNVNMDTYEYPNYGGTVIDIPVDWFCDDCNKHFYIMEKELEYEKK